MFSSSTKENFPFEGKPYLIHIKVNCFTDKNFISKNNLFWGQAVILLVGSGVETGRIYNQNVLLCVSSHHYRCHRLAIMSYIPQLLTTK